MSYLRDPFYVWMGDDGLHIWRRETNEVYDDYVHGCGFTAGVRLPEDVFDAICLMRAAEIEENGDRPARESAALDKYGGNFGADALYRKLGRVPPWEQETTTSA